MKVNLAVIGQGAVTPAGIGLEALRHAVPVPVLAAGLRRPDQPWPTFRVDLKNPAFQRWQREPRLRRSSPISLFLVEAAEQALGGISAADRAQTGLIVAFSAGCLAYSHRFFEGILAQGQKLASPALFPETVFNSPGSHVAAALQLNGAAYALIGDETAWIAALKTASLWLQKGRVRQVLVLGAEEFDPLVIDAYESARWLRCGGGPAGFRPGEGAAGLLVRQAEAGDARRIVEARDGFIYRTKMQVAAAAERMLRDVEPAAPFHRTARRNWLGALEEKWSAGHPALPGGEATYLGEAFTASAAWNTIRALDALPRDVEAFLPIWGLNHQLGVLSLKSGS
jgi:hypothetical protein